MEVNEIVNKIIIDAGLEIPTKYDDRFIYINNGFDSEVTYNDIYFDGKYIGGFYLETIGINIMIGRLYEPKVELSDKFKKEYNIL